MHLDVVRVTREKRLYWRTLERGHLLSKME